MIKIKRLNLLESVSAPRIGVTVEIDEVSMTCRVTADTVTKPSAPTGLSFTALGNGILLDWNDNPTSENVTSYHIYRSTAQGGPYSSIDTSAASSYADLSASADTVYWYHVVATNSGGDSDPTEVQATYASDTTAPGVPVITATSLVGAEAVQIDWTPPVDADLAGFNVYRATSSGGTYSKLNSTGLVASPTYTDLGATAGTHWYYHVTAVDQTGNESAAAATDFDVPASDTTPPSVPTGVAGLDVHTAIRVSWTPNTEPDLASYSVYRSDDSYTSAIASGLTSATYDDTSAVVGTPYSYKVLAIDTSTNSSAKSSASAATTRTTSTTGSLTSFIQSGSMAPCVAHARGVRFTKYRGKTNSDGTVTITFTDTPDFEALTNGTELTARYEWNMAAGASQPQGSYATGRGFNFAHAYDVPGTYTVRLTRTDDGGVVRTYESSVVVLADSRRVVYCSVDGDNSSTAQGSAPTTPVSLSRAAAILNTTADCKVLLRYGDTFNISAGIFTLSKDNQMISSNALFAKAGATTKPKVVFNVAGSGTRTFVTVASSAHNAVVENFQLDRAYSGGSKLNDVGIQNNGINTLIRGVVFQHIGKPVDVDQVNANTRWMLIQDCACPLVDSMQYNFTFCKGGDFVILGCFVYNSVQEHIFRISQCDRICLAYNNLSNREVSSSDIVKTVTNFQQGSFCYQYKNTLTADVGTLGSHQAGTVQIGPLNHSTGHVEEYCRYCVLDENNISAFVEIEDGAHEVMIRNNIITKDTFCFQIYGHGEGKDALGRPLNTRTSDKIYIYNNTLVDNGKGIQPLRVKYAFDTFEFKNNLIVAPNLVRSDATPNAAMYFGGGFGTSNVVQRNIVPTALDLISYHSTLEATSAFNTRAGSGNNAVATVTLDGNFRPTFNANSTLARPVKGVFSSINGTARASTDASWTPGAYQL